MKSLRQPSLKLKGKVLLVFENDRSVKSGHGYDTTTSTITLTGMGFGLKQARQKK